MVQADPEKQNYGYTCSPANWSKTGDAFINGI